MKNDKLTYRLLTNKQVFTHNIWIQRYFDVWTQAICKRQKTLNQS